MQLALFHDIELIFRELTCRSIKKIVAIKPASLKKHLIVRACLKFTCWGHEVCEF